MVITLTLKIVPLALEALRCTHPCDVDTQVAGTAKASDLGILTFERACPLLYEFFPFIRAEASDTYRFGNGNSAMYVVRGCGARLLRGIDVVEVGNRYHVVGQPVELRDA